MKYLQLLKSIKSILVGYCIGSTAAYYVCTWTGVQMIGLRYQFVSLISLCVCSLLIDAMKISNKAGQYDYQDGKLVFKEDDDTSVEKGSDD